MPGGLSWPTDAGRIRLHYGHSHGAPVNLNLHLTAIIRLINNKLIETLPRRAQRDAEGFFVF